MKLLGTIAALTIGLTSICQAQPSDTITARYLFSTCRSESPECGRMFREVYEEAKSEPINMLPPDDHSQGKRIPMDCTKAFAANLSEKDVYNSFMYVAKNFMESGQPALKLMYRAVDLTGFSLFGTGCFLPKAYWDQVNKDEKIKK